MNWLDGPGASKHPRMTVTLDYSLTGNANGGLVQVTGTGSFNTDVGSIQLTVDSRDGPLRPSSSSVSC